MNKVGHSSPDLSCTRLMAGPWVPEPDSGRLRDLTFLLSSLIQFVIQNQDADFFQVRAPQSLIPVQVLSHNQPNCPGILSISIHTQR